MPRFSDIVGQTRAIQALQRSIAANRLAHAYLFSGPRGVGKRTTALALASALNCTTRPGVGCRSCDACHKVAHGHHPDVVTVSRDGASIKIDQIRGLEPYLAMPPHEGNFRLIVLDDADALNLHAANALLKAVEEPRNDTVFVLCSAAPHRVVPTLLSRCRRVRFSPLAREQLLEVVSQSDPPLEAEQAALQWACAVAEGSPGRAWQLLTDDSAAAARQLAEQIESAAAQRSALEVFAAAEGARKTDRAVLLCTIELLQLRLRDRLLLSAGVCGERLVFADSTDAETTHRPDRASPRILRQLRAVQNAQRALESNANAVLTLENLTFALQEETSP